MKKCLLLPLLSLFWSVTTAQIVINSTDMPVAGDTLRMSNGVAFTGMDATQTGANYTWDFSGLTSLTQTIDTFLSVSNTDPVYAIYFANVGFNKNRANVAQRGISFNSIPGLSINEVYNFFYNSSSRYEQAGFGAAINNVTIPTGYSPHDTVYHFPLNFGNADSSRSRYSVNIPNLFYFRSNTIRHNEADGWGSLTTPYGTFDVLRVKTTINELDSVYIDTLGLGIAFPVPEQIQYKWLGKGQGEPLLQINTTTNGTVTQIIYRDSVRAPFNIGVVDRNVVTLGPSVFPNPAGTLQSIVYSLSEAATVKLEVYDLLGNKVVTLADGRQSAQKHIYTLNLAEEKFAPGVYLLQLSVNGKNHLQKLIVNK